MLSFFIACCLITTRVIAADTEADVLGSSRKLRIGVLPFFEMGHIPPMFSIVDELLDRGHHVDIYVVEPYGESYTNLKAEQLIAPHPRLDIMNFGPKLNTTVMNPGVIDKLMSVGALEGLFEIDQAQKVHDDVFLSTVRGVLSTTHRPDLYLIDSAVDLAVPLALDTGVPVVRMWALLMTPTMISKQVYDASAPAIGTGLSGPEESLMKRVLNFLVLTLFSMTQSMNNYKDVPIITQSIYGFDYNQPLCPNVMPVGFLSRRADASPSSSEDALVAGWEQWLRNTCHLGAVYINLGSLAKTNAHRTAILEDAVLRLADGGMCVVWRIPEESFAHLTRIEASNGPGDRDRVFTDEHFPLVRLATWLPFSPKRLLRLDAVRAFVTHCGDASVYESIDATTPLVGIPLFCDQYEVCARINEAGIGISNQDKSTFSSDVLVDAVQRVLSQEDKMVENLRELRAMGHFLGGRRRASELIEMVALTPANADRFTCASSSFPFWKQKNFDVYMFLLLMVGSSVGIIVAAVFLVRKYSVGYFKKVKQM